MQVDVRDVGLIPRSGKSPGGGHGIPLQYSCLVNPMDIGAWQATVHRVAQSQTQLKQLSRNTCTAHLVNLLYHWKTTVCVVKPKYTNIPHKKTENKSKLVILFWRRQWQRRIPWTEEPGRLQSMGSLRVGHDWVTSLSLFTFMHWRRKWQPTPVFLPGESQGWESLVGCCLWGRTKSDTTEAT